MCVDRFFDLTCVSNCHYFVMPRRIINIWKMKNLWIDRRFFMVGMTGFEPATPSSLTKCATKLRYIPMPAVI